MEMVRYERIEQERNLPFLVWRPPLPRLILSSGPLGGGLGIRDWVLNATVAHGYDRPDPAEHLEQLAEGVGLSGAGIGLMTAVWVDQCVYRFEDGVQVWATTGVNEALWAAAPSPAWHQQTPAVGTINLVVDLPVRLADAALVNAVITATEAKSQALAEATLPGTGTATDAICLLCPPGGPAEPYGGPRSVWGSRVARGVHSAVAEGLRIWEKPS